MIVLSHRLRNALLGALTDAIHDDPNDEDLHALQHLVAACAPQERQRVYQRWGSVAGVGVSMDAAVGKHQIEARDVHPLTLACEQLRTFGRLHGLTIDVVMRRREP